MQGASQQRHAGAGGLAAGSAPASGSISILLHDAESKPAKQVKGQTEAMLKPENPAEPRTLLPSKTCWLFEQQDRAGLVEMGDVAAAPDI